MTIYFGADHGGFDLKEKLKAALHSEAYDVVDLSAPEKQEGDDYPDYAAAVAAKVSAAPDTNRGIVVCRSGFGVDIVANKFKNVRAALAASPDHIYQGRHDDDVNVLAIAADFTDEASALKMAKVFMTTPFAGDERYRRRLQKISDIEAGDTN